MTDQEVCQDHLVSQTELLRQEAQVSVGTLWSQLKPERRTQLSQRLAELIQRIRKTACQEENSHDGA